MAVTWEAMDLVMRVPRFYPDSFYIFRRRCLPDYRKVAKRVIDYLKEQVMYK